MSLQLGTRPPALTLPSTKGEPLDLAALRGRKVVLFIYPKDDTQSCTREALDFNALLPEFEAAGTTVIGISPDPLAKHFKFKEKHGLALTLASDEETRVLRAWGVWVEKSMYGRRFMGAERTTLLLDQDGRLARLWRKVRVPGHAQEVLEAARSL